MSDVQFSLCTNEMKLFSVKTTVYSMVCFYWTKRCRSYLGNPLLPHSFHHCKGVISRHVTPATEMEPQGPVGREERPTNQLIGSIRYVWQNCQDVAFNVLHCWFPQCKWVWPMLSYLSVLLDHLIWPRTEEEIKVQYTTNGPICDGWVGL